MGIRGDLGEEPGVRVRSSRGTHGLSRLGGGRGRSERLDRGGGREAGMAPGEGVTLTREPGSGAGELGQASDTLRREGQ